MKMGTFESDIVRRITRLETKLVRGFEELGINIDENENWLTVDDELEVVYINTLARSPLATLKKMSNSGATKAGHEYTLIFNNKKVGSIVFWV